MRNTLNFLYITHNKLVRSPSLQPSLYIDICGWQYIFFSDWTAFTYLLINAHNSALAKQLCFD